MRHWRHADAITYRARMNTNLWRHTHPCDGRVVTKDHFTEAELLRLLPDADRAEETDVVARIPAVGHRFTSGLTRREAGEYAATGTLVASPGPIRWPGTACRVIGARDEVRPAKAATASTTAVSGDRINCLHGG